MHASAMIRAVWILALLSLGSCRRETAACVGYDPVQGNCFDTELDLDDVRTMAVDGSTLPAGPSACHAPVLVRITNVRDGDTFDVVGVSDPTFMGGVRLIGVDSPEIEHPPVPADCWGNNAHLFSTALDGRLVWLTFDADCYDPYDRWLAYMWIGSGTGDLWQRQLLERGNARILTISPNDALAASFAESEAHAMAQSLGMWTCAAP